ncbi:hypothetical protein ACTVZO_43800 [Streptomyces sp. IBSNAI002]|uniref:hypothetical protein n=1 Tax=Streptomyces sp. IBSNAI002 TaxID=3457500 RepID=UPI003FD68C89
MRRAPRTTLPRPVTATVTLALLLAPAPAASASASASAPSGHTAPAVDLVRASEPARLPGTAALLTAFLTADGLRSAGHGTPPDEDSPPGPVTLGETRAVHTLNPDFVRGLPGAPPARADAATTTATGANGRTATVRTALAQGRWQVVAIASGDEEERYARAAGTNRTAFLEPQTNTWYAWNHGTDRVEPLDGAPGNGLGAAAGLSVAGYQRQVSERYATQLPGSAYDAEGLGGGGGGAEQAEATAEPPGPRFPPLPAALALLTGLALAAAGLARRASPRPRPAAPVPVDDGRAGTDQADCAPDRRRR